MKKNIDHHLLRPLDRRRTLTADRKAILRALEQLDDRTLGRAVLPGISKVVENARRSGSQELWKDPVFARKQVVLAEALYKSRLISRSKYVFFASSPVDTINEERWLDGRFNDELREITLELEAMDKKSGLLPDQYWPKDQAPDEFRSRYNALHGQYNAVIEQHFTTALSEFGVADLADLRERSPDEFDRLLERGRRSVHHKGEDIPILKDIVVRYEEEASRAASATAYTAGVTLLGAALEGLLLIRCLRSKRKAIRTASALPKKQRPQFPDDPTNWTLKNLIDTCLLAEWLPRISTEYATYDPAALADLLRNMRNLVHPGRCVRERPWSETYERDYRDVEAIYVTLRSKLLGRRSLTDTAP
jgi:predicted ATPase